MTAAPQLLPDTLEILLAEADPLEVELATRALRRIAPAGQVGVARDGEEALDYLLGRGRYRHRFGAPVPRVTLLELKLPKLDGLEVLRALRANPRTNTAPVIVFTSALEPRDIVQAYQLGANSCVRKPVNFDEFNRIVQTVVRYWLELNEPPPAPAPARGPS